MPKKKVTTQLEVVTPEGVAYENQITALEAPASDGLIGIWPRHAPLVTALQIGVLEVKIGEQQLPIPVSDGFMEVTPQEIKIVVRTAEHPGEIDVERAESARERAEQRLQSDSGQIDFARAEAALERALARLEAVDRHQGL